jgi:ligand-binding sensor domain-containing protein
MLGALIGTAAAGDAWQNFTAETAAGLPGNEIQFLEPARAGGIWVGTDNGVARFADGKFEPVLGGDGKPLQGKAWCVQEASDGSLWIGHERGATRVAQGKVTDMLPGHEVAPILEVRPGVLWAIGKRPGGRDNRLYRFTGKEWERMPGSEKHKIEDMLLAASGRVWVVIEGNGVLEVNPEAGYDKATHHLQGLNVTAVYEDARKMVWCGQWARGVAVWDGTAWTRHLADAKESAILRLCSDAGSNMWVATSASGLYRCPFNKQEWTQDLQGEGAINLMAPDREGRVWISSQMTGGLRYWDGQKWIVSLDSPLPIRCFLQTPDGCRYGGGVLDGLHVLKKK